MRIVCQFSCGAASAIATKIMLNEYPSYMVFILNAFIKEEHEDNQRFLNDCEKWFEHPIIRLRDGKYQASTDNVWKQKQFMKGLRGAPCSIALKRDVLDLNSKDDDVIVLGYTKEEQHRFDQIRDRFPDKKFKAPLIEHGLEKQDCLTLLDRAGIQLPAMYLLGFNNANCIGCPKGGQNYWQKIRSVFPSRFEEVSKLQQSIGPGAYFLAFRSGPRKGERMSLKELPEGPGNMADEPEFSCSFFCEQMDKELSA